MYFAATVVGVKKRNAGSLWARVDEGGCFTVKVTRKMRTCGLQGCRCCTSASAKRQSSTSQHRLSKDVLGAVRSELSGDSILSHLKQSQMSLARICAATSNTPKNEYQIRATPSTRHSPILVTVSSCELPRALDHMALPPGLLLQSRVCIF